MKIKICGITNSVDAHCAVDNGADLIGFIFYKDSPRYVPPNTARDIINKLPEGTTKVGVFVDESNENMISILQFCGLDTLQLHGQESLDQVKKLGKLSVIKAFAPRNMQDLNLLRKYKPYTLLIDAPCQEHGGIGQTCDWELAQKISSQYQIFLAGGLTPENIATAIELVKPYGVDVSSGVEKDKGIKDPAKIKTLLKRFAD